MSENSEEDCGCNSNKEELQPDQFEYIRNKMAETSDNLQDMLNKFQGINLDSFSVSNMEKELEKVSSYLYSGDFIKSMENVLSKNSAMEQSPVVDIPSKIKSPIGYVWIDENGEQKFSPVKPDDIVSMPVYGE